MIKSESGNNCLKQVPGSKNIVVLFEMKNCILTDYFFHYRFEKVI